LSGLKSIRCKEGVEVGDLSSEIWRPEGEESTGLCFRTPTHTPEACLRVVRAGFAGVVLKTNSREAPGPLLHTVAWPTYRLIDIDSKEEWKPIPPKKSAPKINGKKGEKKPPYPACLNSPGIILNYFLNEDYIITYANRTKELLAPYNCKAIVEEGDIYSIYTGDRITWKVISKGPFRHLCSLMPVPAIPKGEHLILEHFQNYRGPF
jgi:hypothetical protein